ncbi:MAG: hypothetical protein HY959_08430 [Ignavibacteriae bacterium]|nr:hypothetical protein [Ignavibacteriota bacterium]
MNNSQIQQIKSTILAIDKIDLVKLISKIYSDKEVIDTTLIKRLTTNQFLNYFTKMISEFKVILNSEMALILPLSINDHDEYGTCNIVDDFNNLFANLNNGDLINSEFNLLKLLRYQLSTGLFDRSNIKIHDVDSLKISELENKIKLIANNLQENIKKKDTLFSEINNLKIRLQEFLDLKKKELEQITQNLQNTNQQSNSINSLLTNSTSTNEKINSIYNQQNKQLIETEKRIKEETNSYLEYKKTIESLIKDVTDNIGIFSNQIKLFDEKLNFVESKKKFFEDRNDYLNTLIGREVGASLFETFKQRKNELRKNVLIWGLSVIGSTIAILIAIFCIFGDINNLQVNGLINWEIILSKSLKIIPFAVLVYFVIRQYTKERHFQEEYAFKSACALTIQAYAEQLNDKNNKDKLILDAVLKIYESPLDIREKPSKDDDNIMKSFLNLSETAKNMSKK